MQDVVYTVNLHWAPAEILFQNLKNSFCDQLAGRSLGDRSEPKLLASELHCWDTQLYSLVELFMCNYNKLDDRSVTIHVKNGKLFLIH